MQILEKMKKILRPTFGCSNTISRTEEQILECVKAIYEFLNSDVFQERSCTWPSNGSSGQGVHLPPLVFINMEVSSSVCAMIKEFLHNLQPCGGKASMVNFGDLKCKARNLECQTHPLKMLNSATGSTPHIVFMSHLPQDGRVTLNQQLQKVKVTKNSSVIEVAFNIHWGFSMDLANKIYGELQAHYVDGILIAYLVDDKVVLTRITAEDLRGWGKASEVNQKNLVNKVKKRNKY